MGRLDGKIALIAGGGADGPPNAGEKLSIGNGRATAITAAREGAIVMAADLNLALAQQTADAITSEGGKAAAIACDVSREDDCRRAVADTVKQFGRVHLLVNNVGIAAGGSLLNTTTDQFERVYAVNLRSHFLMMRYAVPEIIKAGGGAIVNVSSLSAVIAGAGIAYEATKAALLGLSRSRQHDSAGAHQLLDGAARDRRPRGARRAADSDGTARHAVGNRQGDRLPALG
jgi:NAD(P)-dependent dehydrogenase (short-subunit alcohol dehydrogenase family)